MANNDPYPYLIVGPGRDAEDRLSDKAWASFWDSATESCVYSPRPEFTSCDMSKDCADPITHIGSKGYVYCAKHAPARRPWENTRKMRVWELRYIMEGRPLPSYTPAPKPKS